MVDPKSSFVTGRLHRIGGQIAEAGARRASSSSQVEELPQPEQAAEPSEPDSAPVSAPVPAPAKNESQTQTLRNPEAEKALRSRHEEFSRLRRDVMARLSEQCASIPEELEDLASRSDALRSAEAKCKELLSSLESQPEPNPDSGDYSQALSLAFRAVEGARLELIMAQSKLEKSVVAGQTSVEAQAKRESILPEINSLSFQQLFRFGFYLTLPIAAAIILGGIIVAIAVFLSMRMGI